MDRRKAIVTAAAASLTLLAGGAGIALNSGIVSATDNDDVGELSPVGPLSPVGNVATTAPPVTIYVDETVPAPAGGSPVVVAPPGGTPVVPGIVPAGSVPSSSSVGDDPYDDGDEYEDESEYEDEYEDGDEYEDEVEHEEEEEEHEYEGAEDDD